MHPLFSFFSAYLLLWKEISGEQSTPHPDALASGVSPSKFWVRAGLSNLYEERKDIKERSRRLRGECLHVQQEVSGGP